MEVISFGLGHSFLQAHLYEIQFAAIFGGMVFLFLIEGLIPRRSTKEIQTSRWLTNIGLALFNHFLVLFFSILLVVVVSRLQPESPLIQYFQLSDLPAFIILLLSAEFVNYWIHRIFHRIPWLWRIHAVHHTDTEMDVTTSHRHHPFEPLISTILMLPLLLVLGAPFILLALYNFLHTAISLIHHSNIIIPRWLDSTLRWFVVTPDFHRMHHSSEQRYTDSNYSAVIPLFDYLFGTATRLPYDELPKMELGLEILREPSESRIDKLFTLPFTYKAKRANT